MAVKVIYFVHGTTTDNEEKKATGWNDGVLSEKGIEQSKNLINLVDASEYHMVFSSDLKRAVDSAVYTFQGIKHVVKDTRIRECNYGDLNGQDTSLVNYKDHIDIPFPNGESLKDVEKRVQSFINFLKINYDGKTIAIVSHKAPQLAFDVILKGLTWEEAIENDWRKTKSWQPGWTYIIEK